MIYYLKVQTIKMYNFHRSLKLYSYDYERSVHRDSGLGYEIYIYIYSEAFPHEPLTDEFCAGMQKVMDLIHTLVKKD